MSSSLIPLANSLSQALITDTRAQISFDRNFLELLAVKHREIDPRFIIDFIHKAQLTGADPRLNQIYLIERKMGFGQNTRIVGTTVFSYHFLLAKANGTGELVGISADIQRRDVFNPQRPEDEPKKKIAAIAKVHRKNRDVIEYEAFYDDYVQTKEIYEAGKPSGRKEATDQWKKWDIMLKKCAIAGAIRWAFPEVMSGIYIEEESGWMETDNARADLELDTIDAVSARVEKSKEIHERIHDKDDRMEAIKQIEVLADELTRGKNLNDKADFLIGEIGVSKLDELKTKPLDFLQKTHKELLELKSGPMHTKEKKPIDLDRQDEGEAAILERLNRAIKS